MKGQRHCANCGDEIPVGAPTFEMERETIELWCGDCANDETERRAELDLERARGVHGGDEVTQKGKYEVFPGSDGEWYFHERAHNGQILTTSEGYSSKQGAIDGVDAAQRAAGSEIEVDVLEATPDDAAGGGE